MKAANLFDAGEPCGAEANMAKLLASEASWEAGNAALNTHGGFGFAVEYDIERSSARPGFTKWPDQQQPGAGLRGPEVPRPAQELLTCAPSYSKLEIRPSWWWTTTPSPVPTALRSSTSSPAVCATPTSTWWPASFPVPLPIVLGHEVTGTHPELGPVMVYAPWGCGQCRECADGNEMICADATEAGLVVDGGYAERMAIADRAYLYPLGDLDPVASGSAGLRWAHRLSGRYSRLWRRCAVLAGSAGCWSSAPAGSASSRCAISSC